MRISDWSSDVCSSDLPISPLVFTLISPGGKTAALKRARQDNNRVVIGLPSLADSGTFGLSWRVVSADGHPVGGTFVFSVGAPSNAAVVHQPPRRVRDAAIWLGRALLYAALFFGVGASLFRRSEEHTSELQSLMSKSYAVFCLTKKK